MQIPRGSRAASFSGYSGDSIRLFTAFWDLHTQTHTYCTCRHTHSPLPWIYQSTDCKLWSIINRAGVRQWRYREMVKQGASFTFHTAVLIGKPNAVSSTVAQPVSSLVLVHVCWRTSLDGEPDVIMRKLGEVALHDLRFNTYAVPQALILSALHTLFILFNLECNYRV